MAKRILSTLLCVLLMASSLVVANAATTDKSSTSATTASSAASQELDDKYGYNGNDLGATYTPESTTFKVWAPTATEVKLNRFATGSDDEEGAEDLGTYDLVFDDTNGVWSLTLEGDLKNTYYTYSITAQNVTGTKTSVKETQDIYSVATGVNGKRSMVCDLSDTDPEGWDNDKHVVLDKSTESSVWEIHIKDFSYDENSGVSKANRGKYLGFTETGTTLNGEGKTATCIDYLKELGITTVQINPFYDFGSVDETGSDSQFNWGYDPVNYNVPEGSYSTNPYDGNVRIKECKEMIKALHDAGISVVMDVVYNHTYSYDSCFEATVPNYYYRMKADGTYSNGSGCGNETATERLMFRNYVIQSCLYWVNEYHVDGFRFDLMGIMDVETMNMIRAELDKVDPKLTMWGEGWTGGTCTYPDTTCTGEKLLGGIQANAKSLDERVAFFNDGIRDAIKGSVFHADEMGWVQGDKACFKNIYIGINASGSTSWSAQSPQQCVTYASCHDNATLWDRLCTSNRLTSYYRGRHDKLLAENRLAASLVTMSQGITFFLAGEEMCRSKDGDENSYSSPATENMIDWSLVESNADMVSYYKGLLEIRKNFAPISDNTKNSIANYSFYGQSTTSSNTLALVISNTTAGQWSKLAVLANNTGNDVEYNLANQTKDWVIISDGVEAGVTKLGTVTGGNFTIPARSMVIAVDKSSFESVKLQSKLGKVTINSYNLNTKELIDSRIIKGTIGSSYNAVPSSSIGADYVLSQVDGEATGVYTSEDKVVNYYFGYYIPESLSKDLNNDSKLNIRDATLIQRAVAKAVTLTEAQQAIADYNYDGNVDINDVTMVQKHLAGMSVGLGTVTVNFYKTGTTDKIATSIEYSSLVGSEYTSSSASALGYVLNEENMPKETVKVAYGVNTEINYYYDYIGANVKLHVKHNGDKTWVPNVWLWGSKNGADSGTNYCVNKTWPGDMLEMGEDGWYSTSFECSSNDNSYNVIVSNAPEGTAIAQSADCKGFTQLELWVLIDDHSSGVALLFYDEDPLANEFAKPIYEG
ncbi:MAG: type I pullulanase [Ruminococcus sp.]